MINLIADGPICAFPACNNLTTRLRGNNRWAKYCCVTCNEYHLNQKKATSTPLVKCLESTCTKNGAVGMNGTRRKYCSDLCQKLHRLSSSKQTARHNEAPPECKTSGCSNPTTMGKNGWKMFCTSKCAGIYDSKKPRLSETLPKCKNIHCENLISKVSKGQYAKFCCYECKCIGHSQALTKHIVPETAPKCKYVKCNHTITKKKTTGQWKLFCSQDCNNNHVSYIQSDELKSPPPKCIIPSCDNLVIIGRYGRWRKCCSAACSKESAKLTNIQRYGSLNSAEFGIKYKKEIDHTPLKCKRTECDTIVSAITRKGTVRKYCSMECQHKSRADSLRKVPTTPAPFCHCGNIVTKRRSLGWYNCCSRQCAFDAMRIDPGPPPVCKHSSCTNHVTGRKDSHWVLYCSAECKVAGTAVASYITCMKRYGLSNAGKLQSSKDKGKDTCMEKYGVDNASHHPEFLQKIRDTLTLRYGVANPMHVPEFRAKVIATNIEKYGVAHPMMLPEVQAKYTATCMAHYGVPYPMVLPEIQAKKMATNIERYGVPSPMQNKTIYAKKMKREYRSKDFTFPSGRIARVQGYEPFALKILLETYHEDHIITDTMEIPTISYISHNKHRKYFPDIFIPCDNLIIEVKSLYTYNMNHDVNMCKQQACLAAGYNFKFMILDNHGNILDDK